MADWADLQQELQTKVNELEQSIVEFESEFSAKIEWAKQNDILTSLQKINARLDKIEDQLTEKDKADEGDGP